MSVHFSCAV